jgi:WD40 repeat protein
VIALKVLDKDYLLLLSGGYDNLINIHVVKRSNNLDNDNTKGKIEYKLSLQGHVNSIRDISFSPSKQGDSELKGKDFLFASCSQDTYIRLWHVSKISKEEIDQLVANMNNKNATSIYEEYKTKMSYVFRTKDQEYYNIVLDSVLAGHEEPVSSVRWAVVDNKNVLLSSSFDFTLGLWKWDNNMVIIGYNKQLLYFNLFVFLLLKFFLFS